MTGNSWAAESSAMGAGSCWRASSIGSSASTGETSSMVVELASGDVCAVDEVECASSLVAIALGLLVDEIGVIDKR